MSYPARAEGLVNRTIRCNLVSYPGMIFGVSYPSAGDIVYFKPCWQGNKQHPWKFNFSWVFFFCLFWYLQRKHCQFFFKTHFSNYILSHPTCVEELVYIYIYIYIYCGGTRGVMGYRRRKWRWRHEFKSWTRLIAFHIALIPLEKVWIQFFSLQLWVNSRADRVFSLGEATSLGEGKLWIQTC